MTNLGKLFLFIVTILSAVFFVLSIIVNGSHIDYQEQLRTLTNENNTLSTNVRTLTEELQNGLTFQAQESAARRTALGALQTQKNEMSETLTQREAEVRSLQAQNTTMLQTLEQTQNELKRVTDENENIRTQVSTTIEDRDDLRKRLIEITDQLYSLRSTHGDMTDRVRNLQDANTLLEARTNAQAESLKAAGLPENPDDAPPADLRGIITAVQDNELVEVSLGRDDGLREGHFLEAYRGGQYLGRLRIVRVSDDKAIGEVLATYRRGFIQQNDIVVAKIL
jgi:myosin heavy subunit